MTSPASTPRPRRGPPGRRGPRRARDRSTATDGPDLIYGLHSVEAALRNPRRKILSFIATQNAANRLAERFRTGLPITPEIVTARSIDRQLTDDAVHQGVLITVEPLVRENDLGALLDGRLVVLLDRITDPRNVGAILRTAAAFAVDGVIITTRHAPRETAVLAKSASGALETVDLVTVSNLATAVGDLRRHGFVVIALDSEGPEPLRDTGIGPKTALVLGAEGKGVRHGVREVCTHLARIDLPGAMTSLNVSNAVAIALHILNERRR